MKLVIDGPNEKQALFLLDKHKYIAYGGPCGRRRSSWRCGIRESGF